MVIASGNVCCKDSISFFSDRHKHFDHSLLVANVLLLGNYFKKVGAQTGLFHSKNLLECV